ncbi:MAG: tRNA uridine-5-carboxymethylaminomethyl(34) synthesis GTPase MnmE [Clostridium sp.]|jgi:tRNA modification GTPase|nr:tRNA uridine-5-carboxymethylaminomethyl(34) synthesis GTPase MnmE [Clostridium sp.]
MSEYQENDTIAAIATGYTQAGIGIVRISGNQAIEIADRIFRKPNTQSLASMESHTIHHGIIVDFIAYADPSVEIKNDALYDPSVKIENDVLYDDATRDTPSGATGSDTSRTNRLRVLDDALAILMKAPKSYTGEDTVELSCHGGSYVLKRVLSAVLAAGARLAEPGEFTKRAFLNGKMDLSKAEAVMDLIQSRNDFALNNSLRQVRGEVEQEIRQLRAQILHEVAFIESALDDPEHYSTTGYGNLLQEKVCAWMRTLQKWIEQFELGRYGKDGIVTVICGKPNVGKSSLLNYLIGEDRAIVTDQPGTTRDILEETVQLRNFALRLTDTAGLRQSEDIVEQIGVSRAKERIAGADLVLFVADSSTVLDENDRNTLLQIKGKKTIFLLNKTDLQEDQSADNVAHTTIADVEAFAKETIEKPKVLAISAKDGSGLEQLETIITDILLLQDEKAKLSTQEVLILTNARQQQEVMRAYDSMRLVIESIESQLPEDFYSIDMMYAYTALGNIIGEEVHDALIDEIFSKFCLGK